MSDESVGTGLSVNGNPKPTIQRLSHRHEGVMNWMLANPDKTANECAAALNFTPAWVSIISHSAAFQAELRSRQLLLFGDLALDIKDKLAGLAHASLDRVAEHLSVASPEYALDVARDTLKSLGFSAPRQGSGSAINVNVNTGPNYNVSAEELATARQRMTTPAQEVKVLEHQSDATAGT